jgi:ATP-dependent DNA ligase
METVINYKKKIASRFIPIEGANAQKDLPESDEYIYSEKIDGQLGIAVVNNGIVTIYNRSGVLLDLPHITAAFPKDQEGIWAGELYLPLDRSRNFMVSSALANDKTSLRFCVFDAVHELDKPNDDRVVTVQKSIPEGDIVHPMKWHKTASRKELTQFYADAIESGKEGLVVINTLGYTYKLKPMVELDVAVIGYSMKEDGSGIRALLVGLHDGEGWMVVASVGGGFTDETRVQWLQKLQPLECEADIVLVANNRLAYKWVLPSIVIQIKCIEIINEDGSGTIKKDKLSYDGSQYQSIRKTNAVSLISPVFLGIREDKKANYDDTGINQVTSRVEWTKDTNIDTEDLQKSEVIFREVYIKESKTGTAIRKFVGLKTNKTMAQSFPPFVLYYTDFSAGRKEPLQTEIKIASSDGTLREMLATAIEENIKKGWEKVG